MSKLSIVFVTNFINHHQVFLADEFHEILGKNYKLIVREPIPSSFLKKGFADYSNKPYIIESYKTKESFSYAMELIENCDILIFGDAPEEWTLNRLKNNKIIFYYRERWFKVPKHVLRSISWWINKLKFHTKNRNKEVYMLAANAYMKLDTILLGAYPNKVYKWGYFTNVEELDIKHLISQRGNNYLNLLWCAELTKLKHPEMALQLAARLRDKQWKFHLNIIGKGNLETSLLQMSKELGVTDLVTFHGNIPNKIVRQKMKESDIFLFTSDYREGWGCVLNESMSSGCAVVSSHTVGAAPFLIKHGENGLLFKSGDVNSLIEQVESLFKNVELRRSISHAAYISMQNIWSPRIAAKNFIKLSTSLLNHEDLFIQEGPCSKATIILPNYKKIVI